MTSVVLSWPIWAAERPPIWVEVRAPILSIVVAVRPPTWVEVKSPVSTSSPSALKVVALRPLTWVVVSAASVVVDKPLSVAEFKPLS